MGPRPLPKIFEERSACVATQIRDIRSWPDDADIGGTEILRSYFYVAETVEREAERVHHVRAEQICIADRRRIERVIAARVAGGQRGLTIGCAPAHV